MSSISENLKEIEKIVVRQFITYVCDMSISHEDICGIFLTDGEEQGFVKVIVCKGTDKILGATVVASHAGDMISELTLAIVNSIGLGKIGGVIHPYPTQAEAIKKLGDTYNRTRLTPLVKKLFAKYLNWQRHR